MRLLLISLLLLLIATATVQAAIPTPPLLADSYATIGFNTTYYSENGPFTIDIIDSSIITNSSVKFYVESGTTATFDNNGGGSWSKYISIPLTTPSEYAQYKLVITSSSFEIYAADDTQKLADTTSGVWTDFWDNVKSDGSDIRVFNATNAQRYFWIESWNYTAQTATIWVRVGAGDTELNIAYGNNAASESTYNDAEQVFEFYDSFDDLSKWTIAAGSPSAAGYLILHQDDAVSISTTLFDDVIWEYKVQKQGDGSVGGLKAPDWLADGSEKYMVNWRYDDLYRIYDFVDGANVISTSKAEDTNWHTIKVSRTAAGEWKLYFDGELIGTATDTTTTAIDELRLACTENIDIYIDDFKIYKLADPADFGTPTTKTFQMTATNPYISINGNKVQYSGTLDSSNPSSDWISFSDAFWQNGTNTISLGADSGSFYTIVRFDNYKVLTSESLLVRYDFEDGTATDVSGHGNDGTISGTATQVVGRYGYGLDVTSASITVSLSNLNQSWTAWLWARDSTGWHNYVYEFESTNIVKEYQDLQQGDYFDVVSYDGTELKIAEFFKGVIDEFRVYNYTLTEEQMRQMYEALRVKFYDESTGEKIAANATVFNANYSIDLTTDEVTKEAVLFNADLPDPGNYILQASSSNYYTRNFFVNITNFQEKDYLMLSKSTDAVLINFKLNDPTGTFQKPVLVIEKSGVQEREVTSDYFDVEQKVPTTLMFNSRYFITVIDAESSTARKIGEFVASSSGDKYINIYSNVVPHSPFLDFTYDVYDANDSIVVQYNDTAKQTEYINVKIYNSTGYLIYNDTAAANDYALTYIKPDRNETYKVVLHIKRVDQEILETRFLTGPDVAINIKPLIPPKEITGLDQDVALALGCLVIIILIAGLFSKKHSRLGALTVAFISAGLWFWGWLPIDQTIIISLLVIAVLAKFEEGYKGG